MKKLVFSVIIGWIIVVSVDAADTAMQLQNQLSSLNSDGRVSALREFVGHLDPTSQPQQVGEALPILLDAMSDHDPKIREAAVAGLLMIADATMRVEMPANPKLPDLAADPKAQQVLLTAMSDSDSLVRVRAIQAYSVTYKLSPDLEQKIIDTFNSYQPTSGQPDARSELLGSLVNDRSPSPAAVNFLAQKVDDPKYGITALQCVASLKKPPANILPKLLSEAGDHNVSEERKSALKQAVKAYGPSAQARLDQILVNPRQL